MRNNKGAEMTKIPIVSYVNVTGADASSGVGMGGGTLGAGALSSPPLW